MSLLEKAKKVPVKKFRGKFTVDDETIEIAISLLNGEIVSKQAAAVLGVRETAAASRVYSILRRAEESGKIKVTLVK